MTDKEFAKKVAGLVTATVGLATLSKAGQLLAVAGYVETARYIRELEEDLYKLILEQEKRLFGGEEENE
jgi:hypothetical protein